MQSREEGGPARVVQSPWGGPTPSGIYSTERDGPAAVVYEPAALGEVAEIPYEKVDRTPAALQHLEAMTCDLLALEPRFLVSLLGAVEDKGSAALFGEVREIGHTEFRLYRVVSYDSRTGKFTHASRIERADAEHLYGQRREELS
jgi:hypothetical protein